ncbi:MAG: Hsp70 family protein [Deltaproteobacteria bacterium]|nr:Hsp70 family protein [Deltaproteobacteria bacterium]
MENKPLIIGIDLGTTNSAVASVAATTAEGVAQGVVGDAAAAASADATDDSIAPSDAALPSEAGGAGVPTATPQIFSVLQVVRPGDIQPRRTLPSFLYVAEPTEFPAGAMDLPWASDRTFFVGEGARERGAEVPLRMISSAKSWLSHDKADRRGAILPHQAPEGVERLSPVTAATRYLEHLRDAWNAAEPENPFERQHLLLTVPASFDAVARDLTLEAARNAGLVDVTLLEEPLAAFYAWLALVGESWRSRLRPNERILVCDVGGGTCDFSLIEVTDDGQGNLSLERVAVGEHILLGGDNMDLALAYVLMQKLAESGKTIDAAQQRALVSGARRGKEELLSDSNLNEVPVTILGRGGKLIGGKIQTTLTRQDVEQVLVNGFFPACSKEDSPQTNKRAGFVELGLPFVADAAITRHLAKFLRTHAEDRMPTHILFNGGVFNSALLRNRLVEVIGSWMDRAPDVLPDADYDLAVARGAAYYGLVQRGRGIRIRGGVARSYYIGIEGAVPAVPGIAPPVRALCVVPFGMEEGSEARVPSADIGLVVGEPVAFRFFSATSRKNDAIGHVLDEFTWPSVLTETAPVTTMLEAPGLEPGTLVPVHLEVKLTEIGTLELWSVANDGQRWRLEFNVRDKERA